MRQLDLFGFDSEPQQAAPPEPKKTVTVLPPPTSTPPVTDNTTLVFADNKIGIKIKLRKEVPLTNDIMPEADTPDQHEAEEQTAIHQITLEEAILEATETVDAEDETGETEECVNEITEAIVAEEPVTVVEENIAEITVEAELTVPEDTAADSVELTVEAEAEQAEASTPSQNPVRSWLVKPAVISIEEDLVPEAVHQVVETPDAAEEIPDIEEEEADLQQQTTEPDNNAEEETLQDEAEADELIPAQPAAEDTSVAVVTVSRPFLKRPAVIEIEETEAEKTAVEENKMVAEEPQAPVAEEPVLQANAEQPAPVEQAAPVEQTAPVEQPIAPRKIKAPKPQPVNESASPRKRGRKSFKEIDAETDLIQLPDDEALFEKQYYPISVVAGWFNVNASLLRFWENEFDILKPRKNRKGDRLFRPEDVKNLQVIYYLLRQRKFTIEGAKEYLKTNKKKADANTQLIQSLTKLRGFLLEFKANIQA